MLLNHVRRDRISGGATARGNGKATISSSVDKQACDRSINIADDSETSCQQRSHYFHLYFRRVMMPTQCGLHHDALVCVDSSLPLRWRQSQQPLRECIYIELMVSTFGSQEMLELEDAAILQSPQD